MVEKIYKTKNAARRAAKKQQKARAASEPESTTQILATDAPTVDSNEKAAPTVSILDDSIDLTDPNVEPFQAVFRRFETGETTDSSKVRLIGSDEQGQVMYDDDDNIPDEEQMKADSESEAEETQLSKTKMKKKNRLTVAELKQLVKKPEVVEWTDVSAPDPKLLIRLKSIRNAVPVPSHWSQKREYLAGKKGLEKTNFELPDYILATGVGEMRQAATEQREQQSLKQQMRARVQPKMGKLDIDYQKLHDAFFKFQTKPPLTKYGETYYEGKEYETNTRVKKVGELSEALKDALNIPPGAPPPWLINMQRFGPPPSYPRLKIPGLSAPIPSGAQWGFHPGGWGKPPVNEHNKPLYGDVFGVLQTAPARTAGIKRDTELWGELEIVEDDSDEEEEDEDAEDEEDNNDGSGQDIDGEAMTEGFQTGLRTDIASAIDDIIDTPDHIELRKTRPGQSFDEDGIEMDSAELDHVDIDRPKQAYQVLSEKRQDVKGFLPGSHSYVMPTLDGRGSKKRSTDDVDVAIDPDNLDAGMSRAELQALYDQGRAEKSGRPSGWDQDLSDMVSEQAAQAQKRQKLRNNPDKKKEKFKF